MSLTQRTLSLDWIKDAKCHGEETSLWYPVRDKNTYGPIAKASKAVCKGKDGKAPCPVRHECLLWSLIGNDGDGEEHGIWGGRSHRERNVIERKAAKLGIPIATYVEKIP